ncbi:14250_t:CDS:2, partial [Rhizophagus irregularis]
MSQFKKESSKKTVQKKDHTQTNTLCSHECSDIQGTYSTISTNFGLQHIALQPAPQFPFGLYRDYLRPHHYYKHPNCNNVEILKQKCSDSTRNVTKQKKVEVIEVEDDIDNEE